MQTRVRLVQRHVLRSSSRAVPSCQSWNVLAKDEEYFINIRYGLVARISRSQIVLTNDQVRGGRGSIARVGNLVL